MVVQLYVLAQFYEIADASIKAPQFRQIRRRVNNCVSHRLPELDADWVPDGYDDFNLKYQGADSSNLLPIKLGEGKILRSSKFIVIAAGTKNACA